MKDWHVVPSAWAVLPRGERRFMAAHTRASRLVEAMLVHDLREEAEREAKIEADRKRHNRR